MNLNKKQLAIQGRPPMILKSYASEAQGLDLSHKFLNSNKKQFSTINNFQSHNKPSSRDQSLRNSPTNQKVVNGWLHKT